MASELPLSKRSKPLEPKAAIRRQLRLALLKSLAPPFLLLAFFIAAPSWLNTRLHQAVETSLNADTSLSAQERDSRLAGLRATDFEQLSLDAVPGQEEMRQRLAQSGIMERFQRLRTALIAAWALVAILAGGVVALLLLAGKARHSQADLIRAYRIGWHISIVLALANVIVLVPLLIYGIFEFSVLLTDSYFPKLLIALGLGGLVALWTSVKVLCTRVPMEFEERMAREVSPVEAPALWQSVRDAAARLGTSPPEHILIGMKYNFYVTELAVIFRSGRTAGKTLFLSYPLLKQLSVEEVMGVIGHELGHFMGADTELTLHFYPLRRKVQGIMGALGKSGLAAFSSFYTASLFIWAFEGVASESSRARELLADRKGAELAGAEAQARALIRLHVVLAAVDRGLLKPAGELAANPFDSRTAQFVAANIAPEDPFWTSLFAKAQPHPMDSHPRLADRLEALGFPATPADARAIACRDEPVAFDTWFPEGEALFHEIVSDAQHALSAGLRARELAQADIATPEGRRMLEQAFPEQRWTGRPFFFGLYLGMLLLLLAGLLAGTIFSPDASVKAGFGVGFSLMAWVTAGFWVRNRNALLVINAHGIENTAWKRPILFTEIQDMRALNTNGGFTLKLVMKQKIASPLKFGLRRPRRIVSITVSQFKGKPAETANAIFRYFKRQLGAF